MNAPALSEQRTLLGHPTGLYTLFFAEMWERFSYYGMRALLTLYMVKGFLGYGDSDAASVYGAYTALVYMTPFFGGMIADRILGARRAVVLGGLLMAAGHGLMGIEEDTAFFGGLALLIAGNGFFKPNISSIVGTLYPKGSPKRDGGFTIFYMGINLGAAMAPLVCGYIGETYGWHKGFGLATGGMLVGIAVFVLPTRLTQILIALGALGAAWLLFFVHPDNPYVIGVHIVVGLLLLVAAAVAWRALDHGGLPDDVGQPPKRDVLQRRGWMVYLGTVLLVPVIALMVSGFSTFTEDKRAVTLIDKETIAEYKAEGGASEVIAVLLKEISTPAGLVLTLTGLIALIYLAFQTFRLSKIPRERMFVVLILTFFSMVFWAFFEQAGSSLTLFTDRNVDRVFASRTVEEADVGKTLTIQPTQEQLGYTNGEDTFTSTTLTDLRKANEETPNFTIDWVVSADDVGMQIDDRNAEIATSSFQSVNPLFILLFGLVFTALWSFLQARGREPSTPFKFALGLLQVGIGFYAFYIGAEQAGERGMVGLHWLLLGYLFHTTGELCLSPVGLSMITKLSPARLVSTVMGTWFLATAFAQFLAAIIAQFTSVEGSGDVFPVPSETVNVYGQVFEKIAYAAGISALICFLLVPLLKKWQHEGVEAPEE